MPHRAPPNSDAKMPTQNDEDDVMGAESDSSAADKVVDGARDGGSVKGAEIGEKPFRRAVSSQHARILKKRRQRWVLNWPLLLGSLAAIAVVGVLGTLSYLYHSTQAATTYRVKAEEARVGNNYADETRWLRRYLLFHPDDIEVTARLGMAADEAVDQAPYERRGESVEKARRALANALGSLGDSSPEMATELRSKLIRRLLQLGGSWLREAERQIALLDAAPDTPEPNEYMALALVGQLDQNTLEVVERNPFNRKREYWSWLAAEPPADVVQRALTLDPDDIDLIEIFLKMVRLQPDFFGESNSRRASKYSIQQTGDGSKKLKTTTIELVAKSLETLKADQSPRSSLILLDYLSGPAVTPSGEENSLRDNEIRFLLARAEMSSRRLENYQPESDTDSPAKESGDPVESESATSVLSDFSFDEGVPLEYWDFRFLERMSRLLAATDQHDASVDQWLGLLRNAEIPGITQESTESVYVLAGQRFVDQGDLAMAVQTWREGAEALEGRSMDLLGLIAITMTRQFAENQNDADEIADEAEPTRRAVTWTQSQAEEAIDEFDRAIDDAGDRLLAISGRDDARNARSLLGRQISLAKWQSLVAHASLVLGGDRSMKERISAIDLLERAFRSKAQVESNERLRVGQQLAALYGEVGMGDRMVGVLRDCVKLAPRNGAIRQGLAQALSMQGSREQAAEQWQQLAGQGEASLELIAIETLIQDQSELPAARQEFANVRAAIKRFDEQFDEAQVDEAIFNRLSFVRLSVPAQGMGFQEHIQSAEYKKSLIELAERNSSVATIQTLVTKRFLDLGHDEAAAISLSNLESLDSGNSIAPLVLRAQLDSERGQVDEAISRMLVVAQHDEANRIGIFDAAYRLALRSGKWQLAYEILANPSWKPRTPKHLFELTELSELLAENPDFWSAPLAGDSQTSPADAAERWQDELRQLEGNEGTYWRFLDAKRELKSLINDYAAFDSPSEKGKKRLLPDSSVFRAAEKRLASILDRRPFWGEAISLKADLYSLAGRVDESLKLYSDALYHGDQHLVTHQKYVEQLIRADRLEEANRFIHSIKRPTMDLLDPDGAARVSLSLRTGQFEQALDMAKKNAEAFPDDSARWVVYSNTAAVAAANASQREAKDQYVKQLENALSHLASIPAVDVDLVAATRLDVAIDLRDAQRVRSEQEKIDDSEIPSPRRLYLSARADIAVKNWDDAISKLEQSNREQPDPTKQKILVRLYRQTNRSGEELELLQTLQAQSPDSPQLRADLARAIAARGVESVDWDEIERLLIHEGSSTPQNEFLYAAILAIKGDPDKRKQSLEMLRQLIKEGGPVAADAARVQAMALVRVLQDLDEGDRSSLREAYQTEARQRFASLANATEPLPVDVQRYALFLIEFGSPSDLPNIRLLQTRLESLPESDLAALDLVVRLTEYEGMEKELPARLERWVSLYSRALGKRKRPGILELLAGRTLLKTGQKEEAIEWLELAFEAEPLNYSSLVVAMIQTERFREAAEICAKRYETHPGAEVAMLLVEATLASSDPELWTQYEAQIDDAVDRFVVDGSLLEAAGTLMMQMGRYPEAVQLLSRAQQVAPGRIRTINNLAIALAEIPGREPEGLSAINQALVLSKNNPEILDTKGAILMKLKRFDEAEAAFRTALEATDEPRFQFHLILALLESGEKEEASILWENLDQSRMDPGGLTAGERKQWKQFQVDFGTGAIKQ